MQATFEVQSGNKYDRQDLSEEFDGCVIEVIDPKTFNITVRHQDVDALTDYLDEAVLVYRLL